MPPTRGPTAEEIPTVAPKNPKARPRSAPRNICWMSAEFWGAMNPAARPWASRAATSSVMLGAAPQAALKTTKPLRASRKMRRRSSASPRRPAVTSARAKARAYPDTTHCTCAGEACRPRWTEGRATTTIETSSRLMKPATRVTHRARHRRGSGSYPAASCADVLTWAPLTGPPPATRGNHVPPPGDGHTSQPASGQKIVCDAEERLSTRELCRRGAWENDRRKERRNGGARQ